MAEIGTAVADKVVDSLFAAAKKEIGYMWNCTQNVKEFKNEVENLKAMKGRVQQQIDAANTIGDDLKHGVEKWVEDADQEISKAEVFLEQEASAKKTCFKIGMCGNWRTLHHYGKKTVTEMTPSLLEHQASGTPYEGGVSVYTPAPGPLDAYQKKNLEDLDTHDLALKAIIAALEDESNQIIGIYGLGGVGKTTLAKEVAVKVKHLFADVAFITVSQNVQAEKIKKDTENARKRIMNGDKILIILDDVWKKLNLEDDLCIPCGREHMNCKILLTSRNETVCRHMNAHPKICVNSLPIKEAWILFKRIVGERLETEARLKPVALKVVKECGGLPLLIQAVGNALKDESIESWKSALTQLQKHAPVDIDEEIRESFTRLKLSYEYLKSEEAKSCFLLCSLFPEDHDISLEDLLNYGVGLEKFDDLDSIEDARGRVQNAVNILTSSCLLLNVDNKSFTKMHDVVRDVALLIASEGNNKFLVKARQGLTEWLPRGTSLESYAGISLMYNYISKFPDYKVNIPHLEIFLVRAEKFWTEWLPKDMDVGIFEVNNPHLSMISDEFIGCMKEVKVLDISWNNISSLPQSFQLLTKLRMLDLGGNKSLHEISLLGELTDLEILILNRTGIAEIPKEIARLVNLRVLQAKDCRDLSRITQGVISALSRLEELHIEFMLNFNGASDCIVEVMGLLKLTYLDLTVPSIDDIPAQGQGFNFEKLKDFVIQIGECDREEVFKFVNVSRPRLVLSIGHLRIPLVRWLKKLIEESRPVTVLKGIESLSNIMSTLYDGGFNKLEHIGLEDCDNVSCLVDDGTRCDGDEGKTEENIFKELTHLELKNLVTLSIVGCKKLERVFTVSVAQGLVNLNYLKFRWCAILEEVIWVGDDESGNVIVFPSLTNIWLGNLPRLKSFFNSTAGNYRIIYPSLVDVKIHHCKSMKMWGPGIHETPKLKTLIGFSGYKVVLDGPLAINDAVPKRKFL